MRNLFCHLRLNSILLKTEKKQLQAYKPNPVLPKKPLPFIQANSHPLALSVYPPTLSEQLFGLRKIHAGIRDISTRKVYPLLLLPTITVRSYRTFSPLLPIAWERLFSATLSVFSFAKAKENPIRQMVQCSALFGLSSCLIYSNPRQSSLQLQLQRQFIFWNYAMLSPFLCLIMSK